MYDLFNILFGFIIWFDNSSTTPSNAEDQFHLIQSISDSQDNSSTFQTDHEGLRQLQQLLRDNKELSVSRQSILTDVLAAYDDPLVLGHRLVVKFDGELGQDAGGLTKDLFSAFWDVAFRTYFTEEKCCVSFLPVYRLAESSIYPIIGRILTHGTALTGVFSIRLCRSLIYSIIHGAPCDDEEMLLGDLLLFMTDFERQICKLALDDFRRLSPHMVNHLTDMFVRFGVTVLPKADSIRLQMLNLARSEIGFKPLYLCTQIRQGIPAVHLETFWSHLSTTDLQKLFQSFQPTTQKVINKLVAHTCETL